MSTCTTPARRTLRLLLAGATVAVLVGLSAAPAAAAAAAADLDPIGAEPYEATTGTKWVDIPDV